MTGHRGSFGDQLRQRRIAACLTQEELAERSGMSVRAIGDMECGRTSRPRISTIRQIANALGLDPLGHQALANAALWHDVTLHIVGPDDVPEPPGEQDPAAPPPHGSSADRPSSLPPRELPAPVANFTGREWELATLTKFAAGVGRHQQQAVVISAIGGTAGVGKTALAMHWASKFADNFPDGQLYANLRGYGYAEPMPAAEALARFLRSLGLAEPDIPAELDERAARYRSLLAGKRMLVVLDNACSAEQVRPLLPGTQQCVAVVTSRDALVGLVALDGAMRLDVDLLPMADAVNLLHALIGDRPDYDPDTAAQVAAACCRLPLALRVAAEMAASRPAVRLASLAKELADLRNRLDLLDAGGDVRASVRAVLSWSYRNLDAKTAYAFRLAGLHPGPDFDAYALAALTGSTLKSAAQVIDRLARTNLIQPSGLGRYGMHDLLRAYACELVSAQDTGDDRRIALTRLFDYYVYTAAAAMDTLFPAELHRRPRIPAPGCPAPTVTTSDAARIWLDEHRTTLTTVAAYTADHGWPRHTTTLAATLARHLDAGRYYIEAVAVHKSARTAARQTGDRAAEATALFSLGLVGTRQGRYTEASDYSQLALTLYRQAGDLTGQARALTNLGSISVRLGHYQRADVPFQQALTLFRETGDRTGQAHTLSNLGLIDERLARYDQARYYIQEALDLCREVGDKLGEAYTLANLGCLCRHQHEYREATEHLQRALALCREINERTCEAHTLADLGLVDLRQGRHRRAAEKLQQALDLFHESGDRSGEAEALNSLGEVSLATNRRAEALHRHTAALSLATQVGDQHELARAHDGLACTHQAGGAFKRARYHWRRALALYTALGVPQADRVQVQLRAGTHEPAARLELIED